MVQIRRKSGLIPTIPENSAVAVFNDVIKELVAVDESLAGGLRHRVPRPPVDAFFCVTGAARVRHVQLGDAA
jgi:hypothetical protein